MTGPTIPQRWHLNFTGPTLSGGRTLQAWYKQNVNAPIHVKLRGGIGREFDSNWLPVVGIFDHFSERSNTLLETLSGCFGHPRMPCSGYLYRTSQLSSNAPPMPGLPLLQINIDR